MSVTSPHDFVASGVHCGIRKAKPDLALVRSLAPATGAALFTANRVKAAPVVVSQEHLELAEPQAVVINSGVANAATGQRGELDARATAAEAARLLDLHAEEVLVLSTGVIGAPLPLANVLPGLATATSALSPAGGEEAAEAILTTDTRAKQALAAGPGFTVGRNGEGVGDDPPQPGHDARGRHDRLPAGTGRGGRLPASGRGGELQRHLRRRRVLHQRHRRPARQRRLGRSRATTRPSRRRSERSAASSPAQIVADGEGATFLAEVDVAGAASEAEAKAIASRIATSPLVKTALHGRDANWGRILAAAGSAPYNGGYAQLDPTLTTLALNGVLRLRRTGRRSRAEPALEGERCLIELDLGLGSGRASYLTTDLSHEYVTINADYRS